MIKAPPMSKATTLAEANNPLQIGSTVREIVHVAWSGIGQWAMLALIPLLLHCLIVFYFIPELLEAGVKAPGHRWHYHAARLAVGLVYVAPATAWIRGVIAGNLPSGVQFQWGPGS